VENDLVFVSFDIETGGTYCVIVQISAEMFRLIHDPWAQQNTPPTLIRLETTLNKYVNPGASAIWDPACSRIHGLTAESPEIQDADGIAMVWCHFCDWVNDHFADNDTGILVAYNGKTCDLCLALEDYSSAPKYPILSGSIEILRRSKESDRSVQTLPAPQVEEQVGIE
jgi:hypothetical protein